MKWRILRFPCKDHVRWYFHIIDGGFEFNIARFIPNDMSDEEATKILKQAYEEVYVRWTGHRASIAQPNDRESLRQLGFNIPSPDQWEPKLEDSDYSRVSWRD